MQRVAASSRILQREAHRASLLSKASLGAVYSILDDPETLHTSPEWAGMAQEAMRRNRAVWKQQHSDDRAGQEAGIQAVADGAKGILAAVDGKAGIQAVADGAKGILAAVD